MAVQLGFISLLVKGGLIGAFGLSFLFVLWTALFQPKMFGDGQYLMVFLLIFPLGWLAGSLAGLGIALASGLVRPPFWGLTGTAVIIGGTAAIPMPGMLFMALFFTVTGLIMECFKR